MKFLLPALTLLFLSGCLGMPEKVTPVENFELERYMGTWYEIARLDHSFEKNLKRVTAKYSLMDNGAVMIVNRGYSTRSYKWEEAEGRAYPVGDKSKGYLKVAFFLTFYSSYVIFELDQDNYQYAFVSGPDTSFLWLLARTPTVDKALIKKFEHAARQRGFDTSKLIMVDHR